MRHGPALAVSLIARGWHGPHYKFLRAVPPRPQAPRGSITGMASDLLS